MPTGRQHRKPSIPKEVLEAEKVAKHIYSSLTSKTAPKATSQGYLLGTLTLFKIIFEQAVKQGGDKEQIKNQAIQFILGIEQQQKV